MSSDREKRPGPGEAARRDAETVQGAKPPAERPATPPPRRRPDRPFIPFVGFEDVVARCGHVEKFGLLPDNKDRFRQDRRKKAMGRDCKACREQKQQQEREAAELRRADKERRKQGQAGPGQQTGRLPDGSRFEVSYDAAKERWSGTLTVTMPAGEQATFSGSGSALFPLLTSLDRQYRATLK
jgi:hypothetical protein